MAQIGWKKNEKRKGENVHNRSRFSLGLEFISYFHKFHFYSDLFLWYKKVGIIEHF